MKVGELEELLRKFPRETEILVSCKSCCKGSSGKDLIKIWDNTNQTFGYIELSINTDWGKSK